MKILIAGATGLVGRHVVEELAPLEAVDLEAIVRKDPGDLSTDCWVHVAPIEAWPRMVAKLKADIAICCLGTTWNKSGKTEAGFRAVDYDLVTGFAAAARAAGARHMIAVSSVGANSRSRNIYLRTKGEVEDALAALNFPRLDILRPGLLTGKRNNDRRFGERFGIILSPLADMLLQGDLRKYRSIPASTVAQAITSLALSGGQGRHIHTNDAIRALAG
jgi:uncharacterized protein YbjT (DUF2867 family)